MKNRFIATLKNPDQPDWVIRNIQHISDREMFLDPVDAEDFERWKWKITTYAQLKYEVVKYLWKIEPSISHKKMIAYWEEILRALGVAVEKEREWA